MSWYGVGHSHRKTKSLSLYTRLYTWALAQLQFVALTVEDSRATLAFGGVRSPRIHRARVAIKGG